MKSEISRGRNFAWHRFAYSTFFRSLRNSIWSHFRVSNVCSTVWVCAVHRIATKHTSRLNPKFAFLSEKKYFLQIVDERKRSFISKRHHLLGNERSALAICNSWASLTIHGCALEILFFWQKTSLSRCFPSTVNDATALMAALLSTLWHNTHCGLTLPLSDTESNTRRDISDTFMLKSLAKLHGKINCFLTPEHYHRLV